MLCADRYVEGDRRIAERRVLLPQPHPDCGVFSTCINVRVPASRGCVSSSTCSCSQQGMLPSALLPPNKSHHA